MPEMYLDDDTKAALLQYLDDSDIAGFFPLDPEDKLIPLLKYLEYEGITETGEEDEEGGSEDDDAVRSNV